MSTAPVPPTVNPPVRQGAVAFIFITMVIDVLGFGLVIPVLPKLVEQFMGGDTYDAARIYGIFGTAWALMQFVFSPLLGALSDRVGRRPVLLISCFGLGIDYIFMALAPGVWWLLLGRIISGITASSFSTAYAYVADVTVPEKRGSAFGMLGAAFGLGFVMGPAMGGYLGSIDARLPFWGAAVLALVNAAYGFFVLPESLPASRRTVFTPQAFARRANPVGSLKLLRSHPELLSLSSVYLLFQIAHCVLPSMFVIYAGYRYGWDTRTVGASLALSGVLSIVVQGGLVKLAIRHLGERRSMLLGLIFGCIGFSGFALAPSSFWLWWAFPVFSLMGLFTPGLQSLMTRRVTPAEQGQLQGANGSLTGIAGLIGPGLFTEAFAYFIAPERSLQLPGAPFYVASALLFLGAVIAARVTDPPPTTP